MEKQTKVIVNTNQKGGVGKTTTSASMMVGLKKRGYSVLGIDLDSQCNLSYGLKADTKKPSIKDVYRDDCDFEEAIQKTSFGDWIQSNKGLDNAMNDLDAIEQVYKLRNESKAVIGKYDFIVIDTPPGFYLF
jgi:ATPases involved in chromosome partitioning